MVTGNPLQAAMLVSRMAPLKSQFRHKWKATLARTYNVRCEQRKAPVVIHSASPCSPNMYGPLAQPEAESSDPGEESCAPGPNQEALLDGGEPIAERDDSRNKPESSHSTNQGRCDAKGAAGTARIRIGTLNVQGGIHHKIGELEAYLTGYDFVGVCESRQKKGSQLACGKFRWFSAPNSDGKGGVGALVANHLAPFASVVTRRTHRDQLWIKVAGSASARDLYVAVVYMPQETASAATLDAAYDALTESTEHFSTLGEVVICGDLNARVGSPANAEEEVTIGAHGEPCSRTNSGKRLVNFLESFGLVSLNGQKPPTDPNLKYWYTRLDKPTQTRTVIDYIVVGRHLARSEFGVDYTDLDTDHNLVWAEVDFPRKAKRKRGRRGCHRRFNLHLFSSACMGKKDPEPIKRAEKAKEDYQKALKKFFTGFHLAQPPREGPRQGEVEAVLSNFIGRLNSAVEESVGSKRISKRFSRAWFDSEVKEAILARRKAHESYRANPTDGGYQLYRQARGRARKLVRDKKRKEWNDLLERTCKAHASNAKLFWSLMKRMVGSKDKGITPVKMRSGRLALSEEERIEAWAQHQEKLSTSLEDPALDEEFRRKVEEEVEQMTHHSKAQPASEMDKPFTPEELKAALKKLKQGKASAGDGTKNEMFIHGGDAVMEPLLRLFNWLNECEQVPGDWGRALVCNIYKEGDVADPGNYRGISLISCLGKLYLSLWNDRITKHMEGQLAEEQGGFRPGRSTIDQAFVLHEALLRRRRAGMTSFLYFVDFSKAFDTVWRDGLWKRLWECDVRGKAWRIIRSLYRETCSSVLVDGSQTRWVPSHQGVRQGFPSMNLELD